MFKYWLKNRSLYTIITSVFVVVLVSLVFINPNLKTYGENRLATSVYLNSEIDYDIPSPTVQQLSDISELDFIDNVFGYYFTDSYISVNGKSCRAKILFSDCLDSIEFTMYNEKRLIESAEDTYSNPIYIDYDFMITYNVTLGDNIEFNNIEFQISRIYETNTYYNGAIFAPLVGKQKDFILSRVSAYSGAYLDVNNKSRAEDYLQNYKPLGRLKDRDDFSSDEAYQSHLNFWNSANYYSEITSFEERLSQANIKEHISNIIGYVLMMVIIIMLNVSLMFRKSELQYFKNKKDKKSIKYYYIIDELAGFVFILTTSLVMWLIGIGKTIFVPVLTIVMGYLGLLITAISALLVNIIINILIYKKKIIN